MLAVLGTTTVSFAGCLANGPGESDSARNDTETVDDPVTSDGDGDSVVAHFDGDPARPECERESETIEVEFGDDETHEFETAETVPYPDSPTGFARDEVVEYVEAFEHAYVTHDVLCDRRGSGHVFSVGYNVRQSETFDWYDDVTIVFLRRAGAAVSGSDGQGNVWEADIAYGGVVYAVDETGVARVEYDELHEAERDEFESEVPDPLDRGELVAAFE